MKTIKYILLALVVLVSTDVIGQVQLKIEKSESKDMLLYRPSNWQSKGWCESTTIKGGWEDIDEQYVKNIGREKHQWFYDEIKEPEITGFYACMNCCSVPDYDITQKRVCGLCGWVQIKIDRVVHEWVTPPQPPKTRYEQIMDSLKKKQ